MVLLGLMEASDVIAILYSTSYFQHSRVKLHTPVAAIWPAHTIYHGVACAQAFNNLIVKSQVVRLVITAPC